jgi:hypothetical protein
MRTVRTRRFTRKNMTVGVNCCITGTGKRWASGRTRKTRVRLAGCWLLPQRLFYAFLVRYCRYVDRRDILLSWKGLTFKGFPKTVSGEKWGGNGLLYLERLYINAVKRYQKRLEISGCGFKIIFGFLCTVLYWYSIILFLFVTLF